MDRLTIINCGKHCGFIGHDIGARILTDSELQFSDSEDPDNSEDDAQSDSSLMSDFIEHSYAVLFVLDTNVECVTVQSR